MYEYFSDWRVWFLVLMLACFIWEFLDNQRIRRLSDTSISKSRFAFLIWQVESFPFEIPHRLNCYSGREGIFRAYAFVRRRCSPAAIRKRPDERITMAAIRHPNGIVHAVARPGRHHHVIRYMAAQKVAGNATTQDQGFVTNRGRYVQRKEAFLIARNANQILHKTPPAWCLFSEDMW